MDMKCFGHIKHRLQVCLDHVVEDLGLHNDLLQVRQVRFKQLLHLLRVPHRLGQVEVGQPLQLQSFQKRLKQSYHLLYCSDLLVLDQLLHHPHHELHPLLELQQALLDGEEPLEPRGLGVLLYLLQQHLQRRPLYS